MIAAFTDSYKVHMGKRNKIKMEPRCYGHDETNIDFVLTIDCDQYSFKITLPLIKMTCFDSFLTPIFSASCNVNNDLRCLLIPKTVNIFFYLADNCTNKR